MFSVLLYRPWRRRVDGRKAHLVLAEEPSSAGDDILPSDRAFDDITGTSSSSEVGAVEVVTVEMDGKK
jgi:hypothetical protein